MGLAKLLGVSKHYEISLLPLNRSGFDRYHLYMARLSDYLAQMKNRQGMYNVTKIKGLSHLHEYEVTWLYEEGSFEINTNVNNDFDFDGNEYRGRFEDKGSIIILTVYAQRQVTQFDIILTLILFIPAVVNYIIYSNLSWWTQIGWISYFGYLAWMGSKSYNARVVFMSAIVKLLRSPLTNEEREIYVFDEE